MDTTTRPRIAVTTGDPAGVGPELIAKLVADPRAAEAADVLVLADPWLVERGARAAGVDARLRRVDTADEAGGAPVLLARDTIAPEEAPPGEARAAGGRSALAHLAAAAGLARAGTVDAIVFAPLNKAALHLAGFGFEDELRWLAHELDFAGYVGELNVLDELWTSRVTSHVPIARVAALIDEAGIVDAVRLVGTELERAGKRAPRIGVAALNPHAGDGGNFGREEIDVIAPAIARARAAGFDARGPFPADTVFVRAQRGELDAVVTMYHDQGQIAMKLMGFARGVTVLGGLPVPVTTPAHGTAYDIVGRGVADLVATRRAFAIACRMGASRAAETGTFEIAK